MKGIPFRLRYNHKVDWHKIEDLHWSIAAMLFFVSDACDCSIFPNMTGKSMPILLIIKSATWDRYFDFKLHTHICKTLMNSTITKQHAHTKWTSSDY